MTRSALPGRLAGKRAIVTGAGRGIGLAIATAFLQEGARVLMNDIQADLLERARSRLPAATGHVVFHRGDVSDPKAVAGMVALARETFGGVDVLVNNAAIGGTGKTLLELSLEEWERFLRVDLTSVFLCCQAVLPTMMAQRYGRIVTTVSGLANGASTST